MELLFRNSIGLIDKFNPIVRFRGIIFEISKDDCLKSISKIDDDLILNTDDDELQFGRRACTERMDKPTLYYLL